jgi:glycosyltransferase involved in cell wall biosynthesis
MRRAIAVVQPTLFEGGPGGGSAYDSVALGLPLILSDISVNKEVISDHSVTYFDPFSVDSLELALHHISQKPLARVCDEVLLQTSRNRAITLGNALLNICKTAVEDLQRDLAN